MIRIRKTAKVGFFVGLQPDKQIDVGSSVAPRSVQLRKRRKDVR